MAQTSMIPIALGIYYAVVGCILTALIISAVTRMEKMPPRIRAIQAEFISVLLNKENEWVKALTNISLLVLTASLASLFTPIAQNAGMLHLIGVMAITALFNLFFGVYIHLSEYFGLSYRAGFQKKNKLHLCLFRLSSRLGVFWHLFPFIISFIQLVIAGHIIVSLFFC